MFLLKRNSDICMIKNIFKYFKNDYVGMSFTLISIIIIIIIIACVRICFLVCTLANTLLFLFSQLIFKIYSLIPIAIKK